MGVEKPASSIALSPAGVFRLLGFGPAVAPQVEAAPRAGTDAAHGAQSAPRRGRADDVPALVGAAAGAVQHGYFGAAARPLFGSYHEPACGVQAARVAVLLCGTHGSEELSSHRSLLALGHTLSGMGVPVLRFDLHGTGDSSGRDDEPDRVAAWVASVDAAVTLLRERSGCAGVAIVGFRLGALLGAQVAARRPDVVAWAGIAPVVAGRQYVREQTALAATGFAGNPAEHDPAWIEAGGFCLGATTRADLTALDMKRLAWQLGGRVAPLSLAVFDRDDMPSHPGWTQVLREQGVDVTVQPFTGYPAMVDEPHRAVVPQALLAQVCTWVQSCHARMPAASARAGGGARNRLQAECTVGAVTERVVRVTSQGLFGVVSLPSDRAAARGAVLLLNAGAVRHVGPGRLSVDLARHWAERGRVVLRLDLAGLGESPAHPGEPAGVVYGRQAVEDVRAACQWLSAYCGSEACQVVGLCAGAYHGLQAAFAGAPVRRVVLINPLVFRHRAGHEVMDGPLSLHRLHGTAQALAVAWRAGHGWRRLRSGDIPARWLAMALWLRVRSWATRVRDACAWPLARWVAPPTQRPLKSNMAGLLAGGVGVHIVCAAGEPAPTMLRDLGVTQRVQAAWAQRGEFGLHEVPWADHTFTRRAARLRLCAVLDAIVLRGERRVG